MQYAILADIHANLEAFQAVLEDIEKRGKIEEIWCLGDIVGYGPNPHECIELLKKFKHICVAGNHDWAAIGNIDTSHFNPAAAFACDWTTQQLTLDDVMYLESIPPTHVKGDFTFAHGSPREPIWEYILSQYEAEASLSYFNTKYCLVGHAHIPAIFECDAKGRCQAKDFAPEKKLMLGKDRLIINPGGVGQPRDGDPRASYALYDSEANAITLHRVAYDIATTQNKMLEAGLPDWLIKRLSRGE